METPVVLFVDDDTNLLSGLKRALRQEPYRIVEASSAEKAIEILNKSPIDLVVTDQRMPGLQGLEFLDLLCARYPDIVRIMLTGHCTLETTIEAINRGEVFRFLSKPCDMKQLILAIREGIRKKSELAEPAPAEKKKIKNRNIYLSALEKEFPGISVVDYDSTGAIVIDDDKENH